MKKLLAEEIRARCEAGKQFLSTFAETDRNFCRRLIDSRGEALLGHDGSNLTPQGNTVPQEVPEGLINWLGTNLRIKQYAVGINEPRFKVEHPDPLGAQIVEEDMKKRWRDYGWMDIARRTYLRATTSGMAFVFVRWHDDRPHIELVDSWHVIVDPSVTSNTWNRMRYCGRTIFMPLEEAVETYGRRYFEDTLKDGEEDALRPPVEITVYFDREEEVHLYRDEVLHRDKNLYGDLPLIIDKGDDNLLSTFYLGDVAQALGIQSQIDVMTQSLNNIARNGRSVTFVDASAVDESQQEQLQNGEEEGFIFVEGMTAKEAVYRLPAEPPSAAQLESLSMMMRGMDSVTGVTDYQRGTPTDSGRTATEAAIIGQQSGARGVANRKRFEALVDAMARWAVRLVALFGRVETDEDFEFWSACNNVEDISVVEASTSFRDPAFEQQSALQLLQLAVQVYPVMMQTGVQLKLEAFLDDALRAYHRQDVDRYRTVGPPMLPMGAGGEEGLPPEMAQAA